MRRDIHEAVRIAQRGDRVALAEVVSQIQDRIFSLSIRMLADPAAAEDATQDILVLVITKLSQFREESRFTTWVYRIAVNYLLTAKKVRARELGITFEEFGEDLEDGLQDPDSADPTDAIMYNELRIACTMAMLLCLDLNHRVAYVLGRILELNQSEAMEILGLPAATYRKRLSRATAKVEAFTARKCGIVAPELAACSCPRRLPKALQLQRVDRQAGLTRNSSGVASYDDVIQEVARVESGLKGLCAQRLVPAFKNPKDFTKKLEEILTTQASQGH